MLTQFQHTYIQQLTQQPDFKHLCRDYLNDDYEFERPLSIVFYTIDEKLHLHYLGQKRVIRTLST